MLSPGIYIDDYTVTTVRDGDRVIVYAGALDDWRKRLDVLLDAFEMLEAGDVRLHLVGPGDPGSIAERVSRMDRSHALRVSWSGVTDDVSTIYSSGTIGVLPSQEEAFGLTVLECLASGLPVVVADDGGSGDHH